MYVLAATPWLPLLHPVLHANSWRPQCPSPGHAPCIDVRFDCDCPPRWRDCPCQLPRSSAEWENKAKEGWVLWGLGSQRVAGIFNYVMISDRCERERVWTCVWRCVCGCAYVCVRGSACFDWNMLWLTVTSLRSSSRSFFPGRSISASQTKRSNKALCRQ